MNIIVVDPTRLLKAKYTSRKKGKDGKWVYTYPVKEPVGSKGGKEKIERMFSGGVKKIRLSKKEALSLLNSAKGDGEVSRAGNTFYSELSDGRIIQADIFDSRDHVTIRLQE